MNSELLRRVYAVLKKKEQKPKKLKIVQHHPNGSMTMNGKIISHMKLLSMKKNRKIKLVEIGRMFKQPQF